MPSRGPGIYLSMARGRLEPRVASDGYTGLRCNESEDLLAMPVGVAVHGFQRLRALHVEMEIVLPREADPAVNLDRLATHVARSEEHTSELQSPCNLVCRLLLEKKKNDIRIMMSRLTNT